MADKPVAVAYPLLFMRFLSKNEFRLSNSNYLIAIIKIFSYNYVLKDDLEFHLWLDFYC